jgi:hypothetical protein
MQLSGNLCVLRALRRKKSRAESFRPRFSGPFAEVNQESHSFTLLPRSIRRSPEIRFLSFSSRSLRASRFNTLKIQNEPLQAMLKEPFVEIDQESYLQSGELQISESLRLMDGCKLVDAFAFNDHLILNDEVESVSAIQGDLGA